MLQTKPPYMFLSDISQCLWAGKHKSPWKAQIRCLSCFSYPQEVANAWPHTNAIFVEANQEHTQASLGLTLKKP